MVHGMSVADVGTFLEIDNSNRARGHTLKLRKGRVATDLRQHFFSERVINTWNHLDAAVIEAAWNRKHLQIETTETTRQG